jgi:hypothetical protein
MNEDLMRAAGFGKLVDLVKTGKCPSCEKPIDPSSFKDALSRKEFKISGLCQACQDLVFG